MHVLELDHATRAFGVKRALTDFSLTLDRGELAFLVGPSGSGKTTVLRLINGELRPQRGRVHALGVEVSSLPRRHLPRLRRQVATIPQDCRLVEGRSLGWNISFPLAVSGWSRRARRRRVGDVLDQVGLAGMEHRRPVELSGGERQRAVIARAIAGSPQVLLADEPTGQMDPQTAAGVVAVLDDLASQGCTVLMATHDEPLVNQLRRTVVRLDNGHLVNVARNASYRGTSL